jgi:two-component system NtrC family response regulator
MEHHPWPGNVRELENRIKRAVIMAEHATVTAVDLELETVRPVLLNMSLKEARETLERDMINQVLNRNAGRVSAAASELGVSRPTLYELMDKLGIQRDRD